MDAGKISTGKRGKSEDAKKKFLDGLTLIRFLCVVLLALNLLLISSIFFSSAGIWGYRLKSAQVKEMEAKIKALQRENQKMYRRIMHFKSDLRAQERLAREHLGWVKENELMIEFYTPWEDALSEVRRNGSSPNTP